jgi:hypothetical protein
MHHLSASFNIDDQGGSDVTLSWEGPARQSAAIPASHFARCMESNAIVLAPGRA